MTMTKLSLSLLALLATLIIPTSSLVLAVDMGGESGNGGDGGTGDEVTGGSGGGSEGDSESQPQVDNDPGQVLDPTKDTGFTTSQPETENADDNNDNQDDNKQTIDCKESGVTDGVAGIVNQATIRHCDVFGSLGDYTGGWFTGCMKLSGGTADSVELCAKQLATKLSGVTVQRS
jgi:hypothetical protein